MRETLLFFFLECFRKCAGDCQSKTSFFSTTCQIFINTSWQTSFYRLITGRFSVDFVMDCRAAGASSATQIINIVVAPFFYARKFPTILRIVR
jgi:uncharacterized protein (DUF2141 family)